MPRQTRYNLCDHASHVMQSGLGNHASFMCDNDYQFYLECLTDAAATHQCNVHAYVLMPNHVHLVVTPKKNNGVSKMMQSIGRRYVQYFNNRYDRTGTLWEGRYKASLVQSGEHLLNTIQFVEQCPVRTGLTDKASDYRWSSFRFHLLGEKNMTIKAHDSYLQLDADDEKRRQLFGQYIDNKLSTSVEKEITDMLQKCLVYGDDSFKDLIESTLSRSVRPGKRGRPRKVSDKKPLIYAAR